MRGNVAKAASGARLLGIGPPLRLLLIRVFQLRAQPALNVVGANGLDFSQFAAENHVADLPHEGIAGVVVRNREDHAGFLDELLQLFRFLQSNVIGLSQMTLKPASTAAFAIGKWCDSEWATVTKSIRRSAGSLVSAATSSSIEP